MKTIAILTQLLLCTLFSYAQTAPAKNDARVGEINGKYVFISCQPVHEFARVVSVKGIAGRDLDEIAERCYNKVMKAAKGQSFDGLLIASNGDYGTAIRFNTPDKEGRDIAKANKEKSKLVFVRNEPVAPYEVVAEYEYMAMAGEVMESLPELALIKAYRLGFEFDAVIMYGKKKAIAIKFK